MTRQSVDVLVVGAGLAGMVAGCLLARAGLNTLVVERNDNFDREFRGEILQPRFHKAMQDAGLFEHIAGYPHEEVDRVHIHAEGKPIGGFNLKRLDRRTGPAWWITQPELLQALLDYARNYVVFQIWFDAPLRKLSGNSATVEHGGEAVTIDAKIVIGADGRFSAVRKLGAFQFRFEYHDLEVMWFLLPRPENYAHIFSFFLSKRHNFLILPKHPNLLQCGIVLMPDELKRIR